MIRRIATVVLLLNGGLQAVAAGEGPLQIQATRALDDEPRSSLLILVRNTSSALITIRELLLDGQPLVAATEPSDPKNPRSAGRAVDWVDVRPRTLAPEKAGVIVLGYVARRERLALTARTDSGDADLSIPWPKPEPLRVACAAFSTDLKSLTLLVRNEGDRPCAIKGIELDGTAAQAEIHSSPIPPGGMGRIRCATAVSYGAPCALRVVGDPASATASFRAHPAESLNYPFYGQHADKRDLAAKHMDVYVTKSEGGAQVGEEIERHRGTMPDALAKRLGAQAEAFGFNPNSWAWYLQDDAGWGRPRPQTLVDLGRFLREHGSPQPQFVCNPADLRRYAWTADFYMNYEYHVTGQATDPAVFGGDRSLDTIRELNEPAPILYLVDTVGQASRWITPAEEELASYAMLGRGARHLGWFLVPSVWEQGGDLHGGIDPLETRPWRYQEGATACVQIWNLVGSIAAVTRALQPSIRASAPLHPVRTPEGIEALPVACADGVVVTVLLNRRLRCTYPRDYPDGSSAGGIQLRPCRDLAIRHAIPSWAAPETVLAFDHDRGFRERPFLAERGALSVDVDAVDTATLLVSGPRERVRAIRAAVEAGLGPARGPTIQPDLVLNPADLKPRRWDDPAKAYRVEVAGEGWISVDLPPGPAFFDPASVTAFHEGRPIDVRVDYFHPLSGRWSTDDKHASLEQTAGVTRVSRKNPIGYGLLRFDAAFDPDYDVLELRRELGGRIEPLLAGANWRRAFTETEWGKSELHVGDGLPLSRIFWKPTRDARLAMQIYDGRYAFGEARQCRSAPRVFVRMPAGKAHVYWDFRATPAPTSSPVERPDARPGRAGPVDGFRIAAADASSIVCEAKAASAWIESRRADGTLTASHPLRSTDGLRWTSPWAVEGDDVTAFATSTSGRVVAVRVRSAPPLPSLKEVARVGGQVETIACSADRLAVGADRVYAFDGGGRPRWTFDLGENRRQQARYGPGRNVEKVEVDADGSVRARTFRYNEKARRYENNVEVTLDAEGVERGRREWDWKGKAASSRDAATLPPYPLHRFALADGTVIAATTQGVVCRVAGKGRTLWEVRRPSRIDAALLLESKGILVIAWKRYPHAWDWFSIPTLEIVSLSDGSTRSKAEGVGADDVGHFGTDLQLCEGGGRIYLGDPTGRIYAFAVPK